MYQDPGSLLQVLFSVQIIHDLNIIECSGIKKISSNEASKIKKKGK
jgi:hypothetical protein